MRVKAGTQKAAAREAAVRLAQGWQPVLWHLSQLATADEPNPVPAIRPSFEMYSPDEKFDTDDDVAPDPNFNLAPPLMVSPLRGGSSPVNLAMRHSADVAHR